MDLLILLTTGACVAQESKPHITFYQKLAIDPITSNLYVQDWATTSNRCNLSLYGDENLDNENSIVFKATINYIPNRERFVQ